MIVIKVNETDYKILEMYQGSKAKAFPERYVQYVGSWNKDVGLKATDEYIYWRRADFYGSLLSLYTGNNKVSKPA